MHKRVEEFLGNILGAAGWDAIRGIGKFAWWLLVLVVTALGGGAAIAAGKVALATYFLGFATAVGLFLLLVHLSSRHPGANPLSIAGQAEPLPRTDDGPLPPEYAPRPEPRASAESFNQFRAYLISFCKPAVQLAINFLETLCAPGASPKGDLAYAHHLLAATSHEVLLGAKKALKDFEITLPLRPSESEFEDLQSQVGDLLKAHYFVLAARIVLAGESVFGKDKVLSQSGYALLYKYHQRLVEESRRHRDRLDWGDVVPPLTDLERVLPDPASRFERWGAQSVNMTVSEILRHVESGFLSEFLGKEMGVKITLETIKPERGQLTIAGRAECGCRIYVDAAPLGSAEEEQLKPGKVLTVWGAIMRVEVEPVRGIVLSPAKVVSWET